MSYERRKKKKFTKIVFRISIIAFIFIYFAFRSIPIFLANTAKTTLPVEGTVISKFTSQGIVIKNETVYRADGSGQLDLSIAEGERVPAGIQVATINLLGDTSRLKLELQEIENAITVLSRPDNDKEILGAEKAKISDRQDKLIEDIQIAISLGHYENLSLSKAELSLYDDKANDISFGNTLLGQSLDNLNLRKDQLKNEIGGNNIKYFTTSGGIISYDIDGYESIYLPKDFDNYIYEDLKLDDVEVEKNGVETAEAGSPVFKLMDNFQWYIALKIEDPKDILGYEINKKLNIQLVNSDREFTGTIIAINESEDKAVIVLKITSFFHEYYKLRFPKVDIIKSKREGLKIPSKVIIEKDGQKGVYIKEINGIVKFRPISIIGESDDFTFIDKGDGGYIVLEGQESSVKTVTLYDEIFINTLSIKEGQILN